MKLNKQKLKEINELYFQFKKYDKLIEAKNLLKEFYLKRIIKELKQTDFLESIKNIEEIESAQFKIWNDIELSNWMEIELNVLTKKKREEFEVFDEWMDFEGVVRDKVYAILDEYPNLSDFIMVGIDEQK